MEAFQLAQHTQTAAGVLEDSLGLGIGTEPSTESGEEHQDFWGS